MLVTKVLCVFAQIQRDISEMKEKASNSRGDTKAERGEREGWTGYVTLVALTDRGPKRLGWRRTCERCQNVQEL